MSNRVRISLRNAATPEDGQQSANQSALTNAQRQAIFRQRRQKEAERMKRIVVKLDRLNRTIRGVKGEQVTIPLNLFSDDSETTLDNLQKHFEHTEQARENARSGTAAHKGAARKK